MIRYLVRLARLLPEVQVGSAVQPGQVVGLAIRRLRHIRTRDPVGLGHVAALRPGRRHRHVSVGPVGRVPRVVSRRRRAPLPHVFSRARHVVQQVVRDHLAEVFEALRHDRRKLLDDLLDRLALDADHLATRRAPSSVGVLDLRAFLPLSQRDPQAGLPKVRWRVGNLARHAVAWQFGRLQAAGAFGHILLIQTLGEVPPPRLQGLRSALLVEVLSLEISGSIRHHPAAKAIHALALPLCRCRLVVLFAARRAARQNQLRCFLPVLLHVGAQVPVRREPHPASQQHVDLHVHLAYGEEVVANLQEHRADLAAELHDARFVVLHPCQERQGGQDLAVDVECKVRLQHGRQLQLQLVLVRVVALVGVPDEKQVLPNAKGQRPGHHAPAHVPHQHCFLLRDDALLGVQAGDHVSERPHERCEDDAGDGQQ
mmetsp:Transcript_20762/g.52989  ORF Transcript_20762/g.52989 Transcript_20762/m.52989 type:complete len:427 (-) Transcript_20762:751-2031(-)